LKNCSDFVILFPFALLFFFDHTFNTALDDPHHKHSFLSNLDQLASSFHNPSLDNPEKLGKKVEGESDGESSLGPEWVERVSKYTRKCLERVDSYVSSECKSKMRDKTIESRSVHAQLFSSGTHPKEALDNLLDFESKRCHLLQAHYYNAIQQSVNYLLVHFLNLPPSQLSLSTWRSNPKSILLIYSLAYYLMRPSGIGERVHIKSPTFIRKSSSNSNHK